MRYKVIFILLLLVTTPLYAVNDGTDEIFPSGNVGIGTTAPLQELDIVGDCQVGGIASPAYYLKPSAGDTWHIYSGAESYLAFSNYTDGIEALTLIDNGDALFYGNVEAPTLNITGNGQVQGNLTVSGTASITSTLTVGGNIVNLSDTTDEYVLAFDTATQTWRGVAPTAGSGDLKADGTVPLTADWNAGNSLYDITAVEFKGALIGNADTVTTNANLTGEVTSVGNAATIADSVAVTSWNLTTPTITTSLTTSTPTTLAVAELDRLDGLAGVIVTDTTACTEIDGTNLTITAGTLNVDNPVVANVTGNVSGSSGSCTGNAATVTNATLTTALTVNTGTLTLTANAANNSVLTIGAGAVSVSGANTGDNTVATSGDSATAFFPSGTLELAIGGTGQALVDPAADGILLWDDSDAGTEWDFAAIGSGLSYDGTTLTATATGAPTDATYLTSTSNGTLSAEVDLGALTTGLLFGTVAGGTSTISVKAIGTDVQAYDANTGEFKSGTWAGDAAATKAITGVGFQPTAIWIITASGTGIYYYVKESNMGTYASWWNMGVGGDYQEDVIISFDADGFTVGDTAGMNTSGKNYSYMCWK